LSYFVVLAAPAAGGELVVLRGHPKERGAGPDEENGGESAAPAEDGFVVPLNIGDFVLFDAGRRRNRMTKVSGPRSRWTIGSFVALSPAHDAVLYWS
jgi:hypothetical protein